MKKEAVKKFDDYNKKSVWHTEPKSIKEIESASSLTPREKEIEMINFNHVFTWEESKNLLRALSDLSENMKTKSEWMSDPYTKLIVGRADELIEQIKTGTAS